MSYTGENLVRVRQAWRANNNEGEPKPICILLDTVDSAQDVVVDLYLRDGRLEGAKVYQSGKGREIFIAGSVPS